MQLMCNQRGRWTLFWAAGSAMRLRMFPKWNEWQSYNYAVFPLFQQNIHLHTIGSDGMHDARKQKFSKGIYWCLSYSTSWKKPLHHPILEFRDGIGLMQVSSHGRLTAVHCSSSNPEQVSISSNFKVMSRHVYCKKFDEQLFKDIQQAKFKFVMVYSCNMDISQIQKK